MKKFLLLSVCAVTGSVFASETPRLPQVVVENLKSSNELRRSSDAIAIAAQKVIVKKRRQSPESIYSSGSSPAGVEDLFPGQSGLGSQQISLKPISRSDDYFWH